MASAKSSPKSAAKPAAKASAKPAQVASAPIAANNSDDRLLAMLAHLLGIVSGFIGALVIWLVKKDSPSVEAHAREALNFQITVFIASVVAAILWIIVVGMLLSAAIWVVNIVFCILAGVAANKGDAYRYPMTLRLIKGPPA